MAHFGSRGLSLVRGIWWCMAQVGGNSLGHLDLDLCGRSHPVVSPKFQTRLRSSYRCFRYLRWQKGEVYFLLLKLSKFKARGFFALDVGFIAWWVRPEMEEEEGVGGRVDLICLVGLGVNVAPLIRRLEQSCWDPGEIDWTQVCLGIWFLTLFQVTWGWQKPSQEKGKGVSRRDDLLAGFEDE